MSELSQSIQEQIGFIEHEWQSDATKRFACTFCGHPYADRDGGAIRGEGATYPARCFEKVQGKRCPGQIVEVQE